ncbi:MULTISPECIES: alpha/beta hydrolase [unclassified Streptomyces]|uniref:alpha/beta fold hydrolase n=1 Tax=unclassified Streptomyces TaxID=2593676 RepID=UPI000DBAB2C1|nr:MULTISPECIES: alpha/beta hydrolase [unclassified Streptomyces]MYT71933.1 alpha/beta fold hydrolase [Streptomyces sp. SID8367]RAJ75314.1 pimeloyl-ACP methyl ester carboxylesterase [Streptomyces sp. PsTaAH-137]
MPERRTVRVAGILLSYEVSGPPDAVPLLLLHGLGEGAADWAAVAPAFARDHRVYALDLRGHGHSDRPGRYSLELMRDDVRAFLDALGLDRVRIVAHSMGGVVAHLLAAAEPERVTRLVLEDVPLPRPRTPPPLVRPDGDLAFDWEMVVQVRRQLDTPPAQWLERLGAITAETLVIAGGPLSHVPQDGVAELARRIPGGRLVTLPVGHLVHRDAPEEFAAEVRAFLGA